MVYCPSCYSNTLKKNGHDRKKVQKYKCLRCGRNFTENTDSQLSGMRYPKAVITFALMLHYRHEMTYREVAHDLQKKGVDVSYVTVYNWAKKFGGMFERTHGGFRPYTRIWHVRGNIANINGEEMYFSSVRDSNRNILSINVSKRQIGSTRLLEDAARFTGFKPETIMGADAEMFKATKGDVKA
jgi:putative transposase